MEGVDEASVRALAKLEQVLPSRLRHRVSTLQAATTALTSGDGPSIAPETLTVMASTVAGHERLRFAYRDKDGGESRRLTEPHRLVSTGRRWYLVAYDLDRADWRTFRVDRVSEPFATGVRFTPRELPTGSAAEYLRQSIQGRHDTYDFAVRFAAPHGAGLRPGATAMARSAGGRRKGRLRPAGRLRRPLGVAGGAAGDDRVRVRGAGAGRTGGVCKGVGRTAEPGGGWMTGAALRELDGGPSRAGAG